MSLKKAGFVKIVVKSLVHINRKQGPFFTWNLSVLRLAHPYSENQQLGNYKSAPVSCG